MKRTLARFSGTVLQSINAGTGALLLSVPLVAYIAVISWTEGSMLGRPTAMAGGIIAAVFVGAIAAAAGLIIGGIVGWLVRRRIPHSSPDWRAVGLVLTLLVLIAGAAGRRVVYRALAPLEPRVFTARPDVIRSEGRPSGDSVAAAALLGGRWRGDTTFVRELSWRGRTVNAALNRSTLLINNGETIDSLDLGPLTDVQRIFAATADLEGDGREWLALLLQLEVRDLLLIYDPEAARVYGELLHDSPPTRDMRPPLEVVISSQSPPAFVVNLQPATHFTAAR